MKLQRYGKDGLPRNEFKEMDRDQYEAYVRRTGDRTFRPVKPVRRESVVTVKQKNTNTLGDKKTTNTIKK